MQSAMIDQAKALLADGTVSRVVAWKRGELSYDVSPALFETPEALDESLLYDDFCGVNLSKYLIRESQKEGKTLVFLKPCDTFSFNQLLKENRILRDKVYVIGVPCDGKIDSERVIAAGAAGATSMSSDGATVKSQTLYGDKIVAKDDVLAERCVSCKSRKHVAYDKLLGDEGDVRESNRFEMVAKLESMTSEERFAFWRGELSRCIRCNACRNTCPACTCLECVFDNPASTISTKSSADSFEENMFHIIRAFHVAGRCTDCGECSRACPQAIPLHLLNRKFIKDINEIYGEFQAGADTETLSPLTAYDLNDEEPSVVYRREGGNN